MKALTIHQPWAQLIALGVKTIETRSWSTRHRGAIAIHAGASQRSIGIDYWDRHDPETAATIHQALSDGGYGPSPAFPPYPAPTPTTIVGLPLGAIVATANLVDVVPMIDDDALSTAPYIRLSPSGTLALRLQDAPAQRSPLDVSDQAPYGDFAPGRYAWILDDIQPCDPVPAKGKQGLWMWQP